MHKSTSKVIATMLTSVLLLTSTPAVFAKKDVEVESSTATKRAGTTAPGNTTPVPNASIELICSNGQKLSVSTGNNSGICNVTQQGAGVACGPGTPGSGSTVNAVCGHGCTHVSSGATCSVQ